MRKIDRERGEAVLILWNLFDFIYFIFIVQFLLLLQMKCVWVDKINNKIVAKNLIRKLCYLIWHFYDVLTILSHDTHQSYAQHINRLRCSLACRYVHLFWIYFVVSKTVQIEFIVVRLSDEPVLFYLCYCLWMRVEFARNSSICIFDKWLRLGSCDHF